jgi:hypothetical protein
VPRRLHLLDADLHDRSDPAAVGERIPRTVNREVLNLPAGVTSQTATAVTIVNDGQIPPFASTIFSLKADATVRAVARTFGDTPPAVLRGFPTLGAARTSSAVPARGA